MDIEAALYIKQLHEDWANVNLIRPTQFFKKNDIVNKEPNGEFWVERTTHAHKLQWRADTGSSRSFVNQEAAKQPQKEIPNIKIQDYTENTTYRCFDNNNIDN